MFRVTHRITFHEAGKLVPTVYDVWLTNAAHGFAYTRAELDRGCMLADWWYSESGGWAHLGKPTPGGRPGRVDVVQVAPVIEPRAVTVHRTE